MLANLVLEAARRTPEALAVKAPDGALTYDALDRQANQVARVLEGLGVVPGDRVGIWSDKSTRVVATMQGVLRLGAAYVPLDPSSPAARVGQIAQDCALKVIAAPGERIAALSGLVAGDTCFLDLDGGRTGGWTDVVGASSAPVDIPERAPGDLAYVLYTSGSTGSPKGVCLSHLNALAFVDWVVTNLGASGADRFSNHAPLHFDLSVLDLYVAFRVGGSVHMVGEMLAYAPRQLVSFLKRERITTWYSVPSALTLMMEQGGLLDAALPELRTIIFAGEPFPLPKLVRLRAGLPGVRMLNYYGPTETNVCTAHEVGLLEADRTAPVPIGLASCGNRVWLEPAPSDAEEASASGEGELVVDGPTVMLGYWGQPPQAGRPYRTGDLARQLADGSFEYVGRRDHMVKVRGRRIELGDIESALLRHPDLAAAAVTVSGDGLDARLVAFIVARREVGLLEVKAHLAAWVPRYMVVDEARVLEALPRTPNGKTDRRQLKAWAEAGSVLDRAGT